MELLQLRCLAMKLGRADV